MKKYDRRSITSAENGRRAWGKHLENQIVALAGSTKDERLQFDALKYLLDRHAGKPFIASNPAERKGRMIQDNRLQVAIKELILSPSVEPPQPPFRIQSRLAGITHSALALSEPDEQSD